MEVIHHTPDGFQVHGNKVIGYVKDDKLYLNSPELQIMVENEEQIDELKGQFPPGTRFFLAGNTKAWQLAADGEPEESKTFGTFYLNPETMNLYYTTEVD